MPAIIGDFSIYRAQQKACGLGLIASFRQFRYFAEWRKRRAPEPDTIANGIPWITFPSIRALNCVVKEGMKIFEYGTGGSTVYFLKNACQVASVEHDKVWYHKVRDYVTTTGLTWDGHLVEPEFQQAEEQTSQIFRSSAEEYIGYSFENYAKFIDRYDNEDFDIVLLDGRARNGCYFSAIDKLKVGGLMILDNAEREEYALVEADSRSRGYLIKEFWGPGPYNDYFWRTIHIEKR